MEEARAVPSDSSPSNQTKQAACLECRRSKTRCIRAIGEEICKKCRQSNTECVIPEYHVGRYKGVKNKRSGLEKAIAQVEQAIKRSRTSSDKFENVQVEALQSLLGDTSSTSTSTREETVRKKAPLSTSLASARPPIHRAQTQPSTSTYNRQHIGQAPSMPRGVSLNEASDDSGDVTVNNADNPLQLLAIASAIPEPCLAARSPSTVDRTPGTGISNINSLESETQAFFKPLRSKLDLSNDLDPVELGLVTEAESDRLFTYFHDYLAHTRWGMDADVHTATFVRSRSAFLFTSVMAASALFLPDTAALSKRLRNHVRKLAQIVVSERYRSVEIVLAFVVNIPWMVPGSHWTEDDETCYYLSVALTIALDLQLNRIVTPSATLRPPGFIDRLSKADCIDASRAMAIDGFGDVDPSSVIAKRLLRTRERTWLALFNLDRGVCLARGRPPTVPSSPLIESCDSWHISEVSEPQDGPLVSSTVLRRDIVSLIRSIRETCDSNGLTDTHGSEVVKALKDKIEKFFEHWFATWSFQIQQSDGRIPPYVEILASHTKLSAYCNVINHPTASADVKQFFRAAGLATALNVMRVAVQSEPRMRSMPNNTVIMVSFAACFVLGLGSPKPDNKTFLTPNARPLIQETAEVLIRIGSVPEHRKGASALFGKHIKTILQQSKLFGDGISTKHNPSNASQNSMIANAIDHYAQEALLGHTIPTESHGQIPGQIVPESYSVFDMTDDQLLDAITNSGNAFGHQTDNFVYDENQFLNWFGSWG